MSTAQDQAQVQTQNWAGRLGGVAAVFVVAAAAAALMVYGWLAIQWQARPFLGVVYTPTLEIERENTISEGQAGYAAGLLPGDRILALDDLTLSDDYRAAREQLAEALAGYDFGDTVDVVVARSAAAEADALPRRSVIVEQVSCEPAPGRDLLLCTVPVTLGGFPAVDFISQFVVGFLVSAGLLGLAVFVLRARWDQPAARYIAALSGLMTIQVAGIFDAHTTHVLHLSLHPVSIVVAGGLLILLATLFPITLGLVQRHPWLRGLPVILTLTGVVYVLVTAYPADPALFWRPWQFSVGYFIVGMVIFFASVVRRLRRTVSPVVRDQCAIIIVSVLLALIPLAVWGLSELLVSLAAVGGMGFHFALVTPFFMLFPAGLIYALAQDRLPNSDVLLSQGMVYSLMALAIAVGYGLLVTGFTLLVGTIIPATNPLVLAITVFLMALLFVPIRNALERRVNYAYFRTHRLYQQRIEALAQRLTRVATLNGVVEAIREQLEDTLLPTHTFLFFVDVDTGQYVAHGVTRPETDVRFEADGAVVTMLTVQGRVLHLVPDVALPTELAGDRSRLAVLGVHALVPLRGQEQLAGILAVGPRQSGERYHYDDLQFMQSLADQAALAVERAQVIANLEQRVREMDVLGQVSQAVNFTIEFEDLLELIYAQTIRVLNAPHFFIAMRDPNTDELYYAFYVEDDERVGQREGTRWRMGYDLISEIVRSGRSLRVEDYTAEMARRGVQNAIDNPYLRAWLGVPLSAPGGTLGALGITTTGYDVSYADDQLKLLWQIADQAATAIDKARLFGETQMRARQLTALNEISTQLATVFQDPDQLLQLITENAVRILEGEAGSLLMLDSETGEMEFKVAIGSEAEDLVGTRLPPGTGLVGTVADRGTPIIVNDTTRDPRWFSGVDQDTAFRTTTLMAAPLIASTGVIGVLEVINKIGGGVFVEDDKRLLTTFAGQAAIAIENARLFQMTDKQLADRVEELDMMQRIDRQLNETLDLQRVLDITLDWALRQSKAMAGALVVLDGEPPALRVAVYYGYPESSFVVADGVWPLTRGVVGRVVESGNPEVISDVRIDSEHIESLPNGLSQLVVPLSTGGQVRGAIVLESTEENAFSLLDLAFMSRLAEHASPAMANANLFSQLERANDARSEFVSFVAHELKTPMTSIKGFTDLLLNGMVGPVNDQQRTFLSTIGSNVDRMQTLVSDLNDVTKLQTDRMYMEKSPIAFQNVVLETLRPLQKQIEDKEQVLDIRVPDDLPPIYGDQNRLIQVLTNLVSNAHKYTPPQGTIAVHAETARNTWTDGPPEVVHVTVKDDGIGISEEDRVRLFTPYFRTNNPEATEQPGTGLGLVIVRGIVEQHQGMIWVDSTLGEGSTFHFIVPLASAVPEAQAEAAD